MSKSTKKMGRPFMDNPKSEQIHIRVTKEQKEKIVSLAEKNRLSVSEFIIKVLKV